MISSWIGRAKYTKAAWSFGCPVAKSTNCRNNRTSRFCVGADPLVRWMATTDQQLRVYSELASTTDHCFSGFFALYSACNDEGRGASRCRFAIAADPMPATMAKKGIAGMRIRAVASGPDARSSSRKAVAATIKTHLP